MRAGRVYFVTPASSGKARRLTVRAEVTVAPCTFRGVPTGPEVGGRAHLLDAAGRRSVRRLLQPAGPLFWSYLLYRMRGNHMNVYGVTLVGERDDARRDEA